MLFTCTTCEQTIDAHTPEEATETHELFAPDGHRPIWLDSPSDLEAELFRVSIDLGTNELVVRQPETGQTLARTPIGPLPATDPGYAQQYRAAIQRVIESAQQ